MTVRRLTGFRITERMWQALILFLSGIVIILTIWCLMHGITTIFMHLYYFPIVLLAYHYRWKGFGLATLLALAYLGLVIAFDTGQWDVIIGAGYRFLVFVGIAAVIAYLSERIAVEAGSARESTEIQEQYISLAPAIILVLDRNGAITFLNNKGCEILECSPDEVIGRSWFDQFLPEQDRETVHQVFVRLIAGQVEPDQAFENPVLTRRGTTKTIRWYNSVLHDEKGAITGILGFGEDITEERHVQDTIRSMQQFQESVIANANVWLSVLTHNGTLRIWNDAAERISGYKKSEVVGKNTIWKQLYPDDTYRKKVTDEIRGIIRRDTYLENFETVIRCADGTTKTIVWNTRGLKDKDGAITSYIAIGRDVSAQKAAEIRARESSRFLAAMIDTLPIPVFFKDTNGKYLGCNPPFEEYIGIKRDQIVGKSDYDLSPADLAEKYGAVDREIFENRVPRRYEATVQYADGTRHDVIIYKAPFFNKDGTPGGLIGTFIDITERKHMEEALQKSEVKYRAFFTTSRDCIFITTADGRWEDFNDAAVELFGYKNRKELLETTILHIYADPKDREKHIAYIRENGYSFEYPVNLKKKDGTLINALITTVARKDAAGTIIGFQGSIRDITEKKAARDRIDELLRLKEEQLRIINTSPAIAFLWRAEEHWPVETVSENISQFGYSVEDFISGRVIFSSIIHPEDLGRVSAEVEHNSTHHIDEFRQIYRIFGKDGSVHWIDDFTHIRRDKEGAITHYEGIVLDITERRRAEEALALEKQRMESLLSLAQKGHLAEREIISVVVEDAIRLTGSTIGYLATINEDESIMTMQYWSKTAHESCKVVSKPIVYPLEKTGLWGEAVRQRKPIITNDYAAESPFKRGTPEGHVPLVRHMNVPIFEGEHIVAVAGVGNKRTEYNEGDVRQLQLLMQGWWQIVIRRQAEERLAASEQKFRQFFNNINDALYLHAIGEQGLPGKFFEVNDVMCERLGYRRDELLLLAPQDIVSDAGRAKMPAIADEMAVNGHATFETEHRRKDGSIIPVEVSTIIFSLAGTRVAMASARDITERKRAEEAITRSEERYRTLAEASPDQIFINDRDGTILYANTAALKLFGLPYDQVVGKPRTELFPPDLLAEQDATFKEVFDSGVPVRQETKIRFGEQEQWIDTNLVPLKDTVGKVTAVLGVARDITGRKEMEDALRESRQLFSDIISFLPDPTFAIDAEGRVIAWNRAIENLLGVPSGEIIGKGNYESSFRMFGKRRPLLIDMVIRGDDPLMKKHYPTLQRDGQMLTAELDIEMLRGKRRVLWINATPLYDAGGNVTGAIESMRDITQLKEAEEELSRINQNLDILVQERTKKLEEEVAQRLRAEKDVQKALDYTRSVIEANPDLMVVLDPEGKILDVNTAGETLTGLTKDQLLGQSYFRYLEDDGTLSTALSRLLEKGWIENFIRIRRTDGHLTPLSVHATLIKGSGTTPDQIIVSGHDITRQKSDEAAIRASLDEKVLLLREIHHRVKNNLQIIISLTNLQMRTIENPEMKQIMAETRNRVRAMSLVHEKLYQSENLSSIDLADYTKYLATQLFSFYGVDYLLVALHLDIEKILLDIDTAIPLGLILNELISNALKHAFPNGRNGTLSISSHIERDVMTVVIKDDGAGMPAGFDWRNSESLGLRLVNSLVDQLGGTIEKGTGEGTMFIITLHRKTTRENAP